MNKAWKMVVVCGCLIFLAGCTLRLVDFTVISSKNVSVPKAKSQQRVSAKDCVFVLFVPLGIPNMKEAIDRAIESAGGEYDALVDGVVYQDNWSFIVGQMCFRVEGTPINTKAKTSMNELEGKDVMYHSKRSNLTSRN